MPDLPPIPPTIVVTASRIPDNAVTPASVTLIDAIRIDRLGAPLVQDLLRQVPSLSVSSSGPAGSLTDVRIRGAEANHTLLFVEGIRANDPASGNIPRFELLDADLASRIEVVRGPQSALWGSEAIGGVVAVDGAAPGSGDTTALTEYGSFATARAAARTSFGSAERGLSLGIAGQRSHGIDSFSGHGERDGYRNLSARFAGAYRLTTSLIVGGSGFALNAKSEFDGLDPLTFLRADTLDNTRSRLGAGRLFATLGDRSTSGATLSASLLGSSNRNYLDQHLGNRTAATRRTVTLDAVHHIGDHTLFAAIEDESERFTARDTDYFGASNQDRSRRHQSLTIEWKGKFGAVSTDLAARHDIFSRFKDATTFRGSILAGLGSGFSFSTSYGQGIAQPTFFDLFGFFPGSFVGNPSLRPERSQGGEISVRYRSARLAAALTAYRQRLRYEIVDVFAFPLSTTANAVGTSRRQGIEAEASWSPSPAIRVSVAYAYLDASEPRGPVGSQIKEQRRPRHSGSVALDGAAGRLSYGASIAYTGARIDSDFDQFPAPRVTLRPYWLGGGQLTYRFLPRLDATLRVANAFDARYQDVVGYRTAGRSVHVGVRLAAGR